MTGDYWADAHVIHTYSRDQAVADGLLVAVPATMSAAVRTRLPLALTAAA